jgi:hypothetical protein
MAVDSTAAALTERLDALAAALRAAGVPPTRSAGLLAAGAEAAIYAVTLEALLDEQRAPAPPPQPAAETAAPPISLAA